MSWQQIRLGLMKPSRARTRITSQTLPGFHHWIGSPTSVAVAVAVAGALPLTEPPRINPGQRSHGRRRHSSTSPTSIALLNPGKNYRKTAARTWGLQPSRSIRTTADCGGRTIHAMEKPLDEKELERKLKKKDQKAKEEEEKRLKAKQKEAARLQGQAPSDGGRAKKSDKKQRKRGATDESPEDFIDPDTPAGQKKKKKLLASQMAKQYSPAAVEKSWYS